MSLNQTLSHEIEPSARSWRDASPSDRRLFFRRAGQVAARVKRRELLRGVGRNGPMTPRRHPRRDGADGPVLSPHTAASRTFRLLDARATDAKVTLFWHGGVKRGQRLSWGNILEAHANGNSRGGIVRDVLLSDAGVAGVRAEMVTWWANFQRAKTRAARQAFQRQAERAPKGGPVVYLPPGQRPNPRSKQIQVYGE